MTWHSAKDVLKDLAVLNDFEVSQEKDQYEVIRNIEKGSRNGLQSESSEKFIDSRTGEVIDLETLDLSFIDPPNKGKGRGNALSSYSRTKLQLQKQLRQARPLGSGDEVIESYCRRHMPSNSHKNAFDTIDNETKLLKTSSAQSSTLRATTKTDNFNDARHRIKATRNTNQQNNALIESLLSKTLNDFDVNLTSNTKNSDSSDPNYDNGDMLWSPSCSKSKEHNTNIQQKTALTSLVRTNSELPDDLDISSNAFQNKNGKYQNIIDAEGSVNTDYKEKEKEWKNNDAIKEAVQESDCFDSAYYKKLREKLNKETHIHTKEEQTGIYDLTQNADVASENKETQVAFNETSSESFKDCPPLFQKQ